MTKGNLKAHQVTHESHSLFKCNFNSCDRFFSHQYRLNIHIRTHTGLRPFKCEVKGCNKSFNEKGNLKTHMRSHTKVSNYLCYFQSCDFKFKTSSCLKDHLSIHDLACYGFKCTHCPMIYTRYCTLKRHLIIHKDDKKLEEVRDILNEKRQVRGPYKQRVKKVSTKSVEPEIKEHVEKIKIEDKEIYQIEVKASIPINEDKPTIQNEKSSTEEMIDISNEIISSYGKNFSDFLVRINRLNITFFNCLQNNKENICNALSK